MNRYLLPALSALFISASSLQAFETPLLTLDLSQTMLAAVHAPPPETPAEPQPAAEAPHRAFGEGPVNGVHGWYITVGGGFAKDSDPGTHADGFVTFSTFLARELEFQIEFSGWYFQQPGDDTGGLGAAVNLRWHFLHGSYSDGPGAGFDWTIFGEAGLGIIASGDDVPVGGTDVNLSPRFGAGATFGLGQIFGATDARLIVGVRWHHMSNARIFGDDDNPDFNAPMIFAGVQWPF